MDGLSRPGVRRMDHYVQEKTRSPKFTRRQRLAKPLRRSERHREKVGYDPSHDYLIDRMKSGDRLVSFSIVT
jgi:hypothetical protein